jgi:hypothetical protein
MRKARDRTAVAVRLSSIPIALASTPFNNNSRSRSSSAAVQSFMEDLLSPFGSVIGLAPSSSLVRALDEQGSAFAFYFADVTYFFPSRPRRLKMGVIQARLKLEQALAPLGQEAVSTAAYGSCKEAEAMTGKGAGHRFRARFTSGVAAPT